MKPFGLFLLSLALTGCDPRPDVGPVIVSVIAEPSSRASTIAADSILTGALSEGLVRFDAAGQIEAGLAERWIVIDGGLRYIFRLRSAQWRDGRPITAAEVVAILKRRLRASGPLTPYLTAIDDVVEMTPQVVEVRLGRPRPDLLKLFAQPELGIGRLRPRDGGGPFRLPGDGRLTPIRDPVSDDDGDRPRPEDDVRLTTERSALAIARFAARRSDLVLGGTIADWPLVTVAEVAPANLRIDPAAGLFGLVVVRREGLLATPAGRAAVASAFDRVSLVAGIAPGMAASETILPDTLDSAAAPAQPAWTGATLAVRRSTAAALLAVREPAAIAPTLAIALPVGPGGRLLFRLLSTDLRAVGIVAVRVGPDDRAADLRLVDRVAPYDSARWYLRTACAPCGADAEAAIEVARLAQTPAERARALAAADIALTADAAFIPLARPLRWSLVALRLAQFQGNPRAWHPLDHLRNEPDR